MAVHHLGQAAESYCAEPPAAFDSTCARSCTGQGPVRQPRKSGPEKGVLTWHLG